MTARTALRSAAIAATAAVVLLPAALQTLAIFVGIPALLFVIIVLLVSAPSMARGPRYRPGLGWWAAPVWFNGPEDADAAVRGATPTTGGGGASARW